VVFREEVAGEPLRATIDAARASSAPGARDRAQIAAALDEVHRSGCCSAISPEHVMVRPDGSIALIDTGVATRIASASVFEIVGKPAYVSPEHAAGKLVSFRSDLYALGCVVYEMLVGVPPFQGPSDQVLEAHRAQPAPALGGSSPAPVVALVAQLLQKDPRDRPFSAQQVRRTLEPLVGPLAAAQSRPPHKSTLTGLAAVTNGVPGAQRAGPMPPAPLSLSPPPGGRAPTPSVFVPRPDATGQLSALDPPVPRRSWGRRPRSVTASSSSCCVTAPPVVPAARSAAREEVAASDAATSSRKQSTMMGMPVQ
jgi:serine/threonine protein kinase